jgi:ABC-type branched-subunit amino acid transport system ATPase component
MSLLEVKSLNSYYGDSHILFDVGLRVEAHEVVALLGRNGAGKSTTLKSLMGLIKPRSGTIRFSTESMSRACRPIPLRAQACNLFPKSGASSGASTSRRIWCLRA